jgi:putative FmdB family regulatory protein
VPVYEYVCDDCGDATDRVLPHDRADAPGGCPRCGADALKRRFSRVAVRYEGWGFSSTDGLVPDRARGRGDYKALRERAERISDGGA